jgi:hypothetical protein
MSNKIQDLNKIFVDVPSNKADEFLSAYYSPATGSRSTDYDNKIAFLHGKQQIFTQGDLFGSSETTVGNNNSFIVNGTTYTLTINNGQLNIEKYVPSAFNYTYFNAGTGSATANQSREYGKTYDAITVTVSPSNKITYAINHGTTKILLVGIQANNGTDDLTYVYGGSYTMSNNTITHINNIGDITEADYTNGNISSSITLPTAASAPTVTNTKASGITTETFTISAATAVQSCAVYYHELGTGKVNKSAFNSTQVSKSSKVTMWKGYFLWHSETYSDPSTIVSDTQTPTTITTNQSEGKYAWLAIPVRPTYEGTTYKKPVFNDGKYDGGWEPYKENGDFKTITHYGDTYYVYKTTHAGLGENTWTITY